LGRRFFAWHINQLNHVAKILAVPRSYFYCPQFHFLIEFFKSKFITRNLLQKYDGNDKVLIRNRLIRIVVILLVLITAIYVFSQENISQYFDAQQLKSRIEAMGLMAPVIFLLIYSLFPIVFLPPSPLAFAGGFVFGPVLGSILSLIGGFASAVVVFYIAKFAGRTFIIGIMKGKLSKLDRLTYEHGLTAVIFLRICGMPYAIQNYLAGMSSVRTRDYLLGTIVGIAPWTITATIMGHATVTYDKYEMILAGLALLVVYAIFFLIYKLVRRKNSVNNQAPDPSE
jgi:uncharacterized membrane protein YdjX (TVP38/TMEM64 family)